MKNNKQKGVTLLLAILILSSILAISFSLTTILFIEVRTSGDLLHTEQANYGALGVSEEALYGVQRNVPNYQPSLQPYTSQTSDGRVVMTSTSSLFSDPQLRDTIPATAKNLQTAKRYLLYDPTCPIPDPASSDNICQHGGSGYGSIKVTRLSAANNNTLHVYICQFDPRAAVNPADVLPVCSDAGSSNSYWFVSNGLLTNIANFQTWGLDVSKQQELILYNGLDYSSAGDIYVKIEAFALDGTPKGIPYFEQTVVDINAQQQYVNRKLRVIIPSGISSNGSSSSGSTPSSPSGLVLNQTANSKVISVSWSAGSGNDGAGGCKLQFYTGSAWADITSASSMNCDADLPPTNFNLNNDGWTTNWAGTAALTGKQVRIVKNSDPSFVLGTFGNRLACDNSMSPSNSSTPNIDENCNGQWDDSTGSSGCPGGQTCQSWGYWGPHPSPTCHYNGSVYVGCDETCPYPPDNLNDGSSAPFCTSSQPVACHFGRYLNDYTENINYANPADPNDTSACTYQLYY